MYVWEERKRKREREREKEREKEARYESSVKPDLFFLESS